MKVCLGFGMFTASRPAARSTQPSRISEANEVLLLLSAGPDQLFVRVHDAVRHCEEMRDSPAGTTNGFHQDGSEAPLSTATEPLLARNSMDFV